MFLRVKRGIFCLYVYVLCIEFTGTRRIDSKAAAQMVMLAPSTVRVNISAVQLGHEFELLWLYVDRRNISARGFIDRLCATFAAKRAVAVVGSGYAVIDGLASELANHFAIPFIGLKPTSQGENVISLVPPPHTKVDAIMSIALDLACGHITVFTSHPNHHILFSHLSHQAQARALGIKLISLEDSFSESQKALQVSKEIIVLNKSGSCLVVMDTDPPTTKFVSKTLWFMGVSSKKFVWLDFNDPANCDIGNLLENSIAILWPFTHTQLMKEAVSLVNKTLEKVPSINKRLLLVNNDTDIDTWREVGRDLYRAFTLQEFQGITGKVAFTRRGERTNYHYDIVQVTKNQEGNREWTTVGSVDDERSHFHYNFWQKDTNQSTSMVLRMVTIEEDPVTIISKEKLKPGEKCILSHACYKYKKTNGTSKMPRVRERYCCSGFMFDILNLLERDLKFQPDIYFVEDERYGAHNAKTRTWNGMINDIIQDKADMTLSMLTINEARMRVVDYSQALLHSETKIMISVAQAETTFWDFAFLDPFSRDLWIVCVGVINIVLGVLWSLDRYSPYGHYKHDYGHARMRFNIPACMSHVWSMVFKLQLDNVTPRATSARFTSLIFAFFTLVITTTYTANLAAYLVKARENYPVSDIRDQEFTDRSLGYKFATLESSSTEMIFSRSSDPTFRRIYQNMKPYQVGTYKEALSKLRSRRLDAFIDDSPYLDLAASKQSDCSFRIIGRPIRMNTLGVVFQRGSKWTKPISNLLLKYERKDFFRKLREKWFAGICANAKTTSKANKIAVKHFGGLFLVCSAAIILCGMLLVVELLWYRCLKRWFTSYDLQQEEESNLNRAIALSRTSIRELLPLPAQELSGGFLVRGSKKMSNESSFSSISTLS